MFKNKKVFESPWLNLKQFVQVKCFRRKTQLNSMYEIGIINLRNVCDYLFD